MIQKTISTYVARIRQGFATRAVEQTSDFVRGGNAALEIATTEFEETTLSNAALQLRQTQDELEEVSEQLLRTKEQNRLQRLEIERLSKKQADTITIDKHQAIINKLLPTWDNKLKAIITSLTISHQRLGVEQPTEADRVRLTLRLIGEWLRQSPNEELTSEERALAASFAALPNARKLYKAEPSPSSVAKHHPPLNASQHEQLAILNAVMGRRTKYEQQEDRLLTVLYGMVSRPTDELWEAAGDNPILRAHLQDWASVSGRLEWLHDAQVAEQTS